MASQTYSRLKNKLPDKWADLEAILEKLEITPELILRGILHIAVNGRVDKDKLKAWDMLAKMAGMKPPERVILQGDEFEITYKKHEGD